MRDLVERPRWYRPEEGDKPLAFREHGRAVGPTTPTW